MARPRRPWIDGLQAALVRGLVAALRTLPTRWCSAVLGGVARLAHLVLRGRRRHTVALVREMLGVSAEEARAITRGAFRTLALNVGESVLLERRLAREPLEEHVVVEGAEHLEGAIERGKGVLLAVAHFGAWEVAALVLARRFRAVWAVGRSLDNPKLAPVVDELRLKHLAGVLEKEGSGRALARLARKGEVFALLLDQNAGRQGIPMDFLGQPALQHKVSGVMAHRFGVAVVPMYMVREPGHLRFRMILEAPILADPSLPAEEAERDVVARVSRSLEARVRAMPEQWLWLHDRWRKARWHLAREKRRAERAKGIVPAVAEGTNGG